MINNFQIKAVEDYIKNPNKCKNCNEIIPYVKGKKLCEIKQKKFCTNSCATIYNNKLRPKKIKQPVEKHLTRKPKFNFLTGKTKKEIFEMRANWQSARSAIRRHAVWIYDNSGKLKICEVCGYDKYIEICHIKSVSSFSENNVIEEINNINNLKCLCPNHHWEFDNLKLAG